MRLVYPLTDPWQFRRHAHAVVDAQLQAVLNVSCISPLAPSPPIESGEHFDRTLRQSPLWREFKRNAAQQSLSADQIEAAIPLATETARALRDGEATGFVDITIPEALEQLAEPLRAADGVPPPIAIEAGKELLALDLVESVNNTLKRMAEAALATKAVMAVRGVGSTLADASADYAKGLGKGFKQAAKKQGPKDGEKVFKWLRRIMVGTAMGSAVLPSLIARYPEAFAWLEGVIKFLF